ncbi:hypothetical protein D3C85_1717460 [compost metagenome]
MIAVGLQGFDDMGFYQSSARRQAMLGDSLEQRIDDTLHLKLFGGDSAQAHPFLCCPESLRPIHKAADGGQSAALSASGTHPANARFNDQCA